MRRQDDGGASPALRLTGSPDDLEGYRDRLYAAAYAILRNHAAAEDCVQETFRRAIECEGRIVLDNMAFRGWLFTTVHHVSLDEMRRTRTRENLDKHVPLLPSPQIWLSQEQAVMLSEIREEVGRLKLVCRRCYVLFYFEGYSYKEIMDITGLDYGRVKTNIQTARRRVERRFRSGP